LCYLNHENTHVVGNTVIDTLARDPFSVLVTLHRRENWGERIILAIEVLMKFKAHYGIHLTIIRHPNWKRFLKNQPETIDPVSHEDLQDLMLNSSVVVTDSGGLQEEAAHYGVPCLVVRESTERVALLESGAVKLVHPDRPEELRQALQDEYDKRHAYGDGDAGEKIASILLTSLESSPETT
jgi:UDP-N-acetylglucosamine 2-epimerase (non-hydrolysing)